MDIIVIAASIVLGFGAAYYYNKKSSYPNNYFVYLLWIFHIVMGVAYYQFSLTNPADAIGYWFKPKNYSMEDILFFFKRGSGTSFMYVVNYFPSKILGLSYLAGTFIYTLFGFIGLLLFVRVADKYVPYNTSLWGVKLFPLLFFLPNLHFWSVAVGKDTISFFCIALFVFSMQNIKKNWYFLLFAIPFLYMTRPHVAFILLISYGVIYLFSGKIKTSYKVLISAVLISGVIYILPDVMEYVKLKDITLEDFEERTEQQAGFLREGGSAIDLSNSSIPVKLFSFLYRPNITDINSALSLVAAVENILLLILTFLAFRRRRIKTFKAAPIPIQALFIFLLLGIVVFSQSLGNLGIMLRMRNMLLPGMLIYFLWALSFQSEEKYRKALLVRKRIELEERE